MVVARDANRVMVYMPHNSKARVDLSGLAFSPGSAGINARLFNPRGDGGPVTVTPTSVSTNVWDFFNSITVSYHERRLHPTVHRSCVARAQDRRRR